MTLLIKEKKYSEWVNHEHAACYGQGVVVDWT